MIIWGVDTDSKGSVAVLDTSNKRANTFRLPQRTEIVGGKNRFFLHAPWMSYLFSSLLAAGVPDLIALEKQAGLPDQDAASTFYFGQTTGLIEGQLAAVMQSHYAATKSTTIQSVTDKFIYTTGRRWKADFGLSSDKKAACGLASELFPKLAPAWSKVKDTSKAEALLIASHAAVTIYKVSLAKSDYTVWDIPLDAYPVLK